MKQMMRATCMSAAVALILGGALGQALAQESVEGENEKSFIPPRC